MSNEKTLTELRCPKCSSRMIYYKVRTKEYQCRFCGHRFIAPLQFRENQKEETK